MKETICIAKGRKRNVKLIIIIIVNCFPKSTFEVIPTNPSGLGFMGVADINCMGRVLNSDFT